MKRVRAESSAGAAASGLAGVAGALLAATCCILPLVLILTGIASAGIMMSMMRYEWLTLPLGTIGVAASWVLYARQRRRCDAQGCRFVGRRANLIVLSCASAVVVAALLLKVFPAWTAALLQSLT